MIRRAPVLTPTLPWHTRGQQTASFSCPQGQTVLQRDSPEACTLWEQRVGSELSLLLCDHQGQSTQVRGGYPRSNLARRINTHFSPVKIQCCTWKTSAWRLEDTQFRSSARSVEVSSKEIKQPKPARRQSRMNQIDGLGTHVRTLGDRPQGQRRGLPRTPHSPRTQRVSSLAGPPLLGHLLGNCSPVSATSCNGQTCLRQELHLAITQSLASGELTVLCRHDLTHP